MSHGSDRTGGLGLNLDTIRSDNTRGDHIARYNLRTYALGHTSTLIYYADKCFILSFFYV